MSNYMIAPLRQSAQTQIRLASLFKDIDKPFAQKIVLYICIKMDVTQEEIKSNSRKQNIVEARQIAMFTIKYNTKLKLNEIAFMFGDKDHSNVVASCKKINKMIATNDRLGEVAMEINDIFRNKF